MMCRRDRIRAKIMACVEIVDTGYKTPCHLWTGPDSGAGRGGGYPRMSLDGQTVAVHIVNWTNEHGYVPGKKQLDHLCRQRRCIRDDHLELVTAKRNAIRREEANGRRQTPKRKRHAQPILEAAE
ncbi:HNH endonuclease signature motif containing protein [Mesorhizobium sp. CAU 1732]|uniref:HNH endonuclease signature motif containing protein n=1 Tax=Mesorhizobium sp. CAU 1732 TaxID=3140358 RepID=UPI0032604334